MSQLSTFKKKFSTFFSGYVGACGPLDTCPEGYQCFNSICDDGLTMGMYRTAFINNYGGVDYSLIASSESENSTSSESENSS